MTQTKQITYTASIDGGLGGEQTFTASTAAEAMLLALDWAQEGDWPEDGCDVEITITNDSDESDSESETVHILSSEEKKNAQLDAEGEVLGEDESEFETRQVIRIDTEYFYRRCNGGSRGAHDHRTNPDVLECRGISRTEARKMLLEFGMEPLDVARKTRDDD